MSEYDVTRVEAEEIELLSGSRAELGDDAARITWRNCLACADEFGADLGLDADDVRDHFRSYGAWDEDEVAGWTDRELAALVIQEAAARLRELEAGGEPSNLYRADDGRVYIYLGD